MITKNEKLAYTRVKTTASIKKTGTGSRKFAEETINAIIEYYKSGKAGMTDNASARIKQTVEEPWFEN